MRKKKEKYAKDLGLADNALNKLIAEEEYKKMLKKIELDKKEIQSIKNKKNFIHISVDTPIKLYTFIKKYKKYIECKTNKKSYLQVAVIELLELGINSLINGNKIKKDIDGKEDKKKDKTEKKNKDKTEKKNKDKTKKKNKGKTEKKNKDEAEKPKYRNDDFKWHWCN